MKNTETICIGEIYREHGIRGDVKVYLYSHSDENFGEKSNVTIENVNGETVETKVISTKPYQKWFLTKFDFLSSPEDAKLWRKAKIYIPTQSLEKTKKGEYYLSDLIGFEIVGETEGAIGTLKQMMGEGDSALFIVDVSGEEIMIPAVPSWFKVNLKKKSISVKLPPGLLDLSLKK